MVLSGEADSGLRTESLNSSGVGIRLDEERRRAGRHGDGLAPILPYLLLRIGMAVYAS